MRNLFTSDHHIGHTNILKHCAETRPFVSVEHMREAYVDAWNAEVRPEDTVWYIGDLALKFTFVTPFLAQLNGTKHLLVGNHDVCFKMHPQQVAQYLQAGFASVQRKGALEVGGLRFALCHFPYRVSAESRSADPAIALRQERFAHVSTVPREHGEVALIHGHVHQYWRARVGAAALPELNMSVDAWAGHPVDEAGLLQLYQEAEARQEPGQLDFRGVWQPLHQDEVGD